MRTRQANVPSDSTTDDTEASCNTTSDCAGCVNGCLGGKCYSTTGEFDGCSGQPNGHKLGHGLYCWDGRKDYMCKSSQASCVA